MINLVVFVLNDRNQYGDIVDAWEAAGVSGITILGAIVVAGRWGPDNRVAAILGVVAVAFAMINVVGGYMVTDRMLAMFKGKREAKK